MSYPHSLVTICPDAAKAALLALGEAVGVSGGMSVPLSADGNDPPTHWGSHAWAGPEFVAMMTGQAIPDPLPEGVTAEDISNVLSLCTIAVDTVIDEGLETEQRLTKRAHFDHVASGLGLQVIVPEEV